MRLVEGISVGFAAIRINKMRSLLTMFGIIIGVASVLAMIAIGDGAKQVVLQDAEKLGGLNQFTMYRSSYIRKGERWVPNRSAEYFEYEDVLAIEAECPSVKAVVPRIPQWRGVLVQAANGNETRAGYNGVNDSFPASMQWDVHRGRFISAEDIDDRTKVCVVGSEVARELFGNRNPIGEEIKIGRGVGYRRWESKKQDRSTERFTVVGTMTSRGTSLRFGWNLDNIILMPLTTVQQRFTGNDRVVMLSVHAKRAELLDKATEEVKSVIRKRHNNQDNFFNVWVLKEGMEQLEKISKVIKITLGIIAGFSLLVGGIGIMNIMLVSVTERTREIGLRKAIGAKRLDILFQFLVEAVLMCSAGGLIGLGLGILAGKGMAHVAVSIVKIVPEWPAIISTDWMIISVAVSAAIGIFFGLYPAIRASELSPVEALRTE